MVQSMLSEPCGRPQRITRNRGSSWLMLLMHLMQATGLPSYGQSATSSYQVLDLHLIAIDTGLIL